MKHSQTVNPILPVFILLFAAWLRPAAAWAVAIERGQAGPVTAGAQPLEMAPAEVPVTVALKPLNPNPKAGQPLEVEIRTTVDAGVYVAGPVYPQPWGDWAVVDRKSEAPETKGRRQVRTDKLSLLTYLDGRVEVPSLKVPFRLPDGRTGEYRSAPLALTVQPASAPADNPAGWLRDLKPPVGFFPWLRALLALLALAAAAAAIWWYARKKKWVGPLLPPAPPRPPAEVARERLAALRAANYVAAGESKIYYSELSDILRRYLEGRFAVEALDRTTQELSRALKASSVSRQDAVVVRDVLEHSDMAKFAKARPTEAEADADWQTVSDWVERTAPRPEAASGEVKA